MVKHLTLDSRHRYREWRVSLPPYGETIECRKRGPKFELRWQQGVFLGVKDNIIEKILGNIFGILPCNLSGGNLERTSTT